MALYEFLSGGGSRSWSEGTSSYSLLREICKLDGGSCGMLDCGMLDHWNGDRRVSSNLVTLESSLKSLNIEVGKVSDINSSCMRRDSIKRARLPNSSISPSLNRLTYSSNSASLKRLPYSSISPSLNRCMPRSCGFYLKRSKLPSYLISASLEVILCLVVNSRY